jgi:outer membrane murein-binding lipoprotein Lpp
MRANQKLNELSSQNDKLREKINQLRKEKNAMEDIYCKLKH